jgi:uncharacterized protein YndB with AHSA1/START domain
MTQIIREVTVACPPEHVFAVLSKVERLSEFSHLTVEIRKGPAGQSRLVTRSSRLSRCSAWTWTRSGR